MAEVASLMPKKTFGGGVNPSLSAGVGVFFRISFVLFLASAVLVGALYGVKSYILNSLTEEKSLLKKIEIEFEPTLIAELERVGNSIRAAKAILQAHARTSKIFDMLEANTLTDVDFSNFAFSTEKKSITMAGDAPSYTAVAAQASVFGASQDVASVAFSNLALKETGTVNFAITINLK